MLLEPEQGLRRQSSTDDIQIQLLSDEMQWTQDLAGDLDTFARLTRAGHFARAESFYQEVLQVNTHFFPVAAEYCDMLIEQGAFAKAEDFLADNDQSGYDEEEKLVMALLHGIAKIHTQLCFATAASIADKALRYIDVPRADKEWTGIQIQILLLSLRILNYDAANRTSLGKASSFNMATFGERNSSSQVRPNETWFDTAVRLDNVAERPWDTASLYELGGLGHDRERDSLGWTQTCDRLLSSEDVDAFIAGISLLAETCRRALIHHWRDVLADSTAPSPALREDPPKVLQLMVKMHEVLGSRYEQYWKRKLDEIVTPAGDSRAKQYLSLMAFDQELLHCHQDKLGAQISRHPALSDLGERLKAVDKDCRQRGDYKLQSDVLTRQILTWPVSAADTIVEEIRVFWNHTRNSWDCIKLLSCARSCLGAGSKNCERLLDNMVTYCRRSDTTSAVDATLHYSRPTQAANGSQTYQDCNNLLELVFSWQRTAAAKLQSRVAAKSNRSILENWVNPSGKVMPGSFPADRVNVLSPVPNQTKRKKAKRLLFLGHTGTGKSSTINALTGSKLLTSDHTDPCTSEIAIESYKLGGHEIDCIDTPGFGDRRFSDVKVLRMVQERLKKDYRARHRVHAIFYLINITTPRIDRALATDLKVFLKLVGDGADSTGIWKNVCFVYTHGYDDQISGYGTRELLRTQNVRLDDWAKVLAPQLRRGARTCRLIKSDGDETEDYHREVRQIALDMLKSSEGFILQCQKEMVHDRKHIDDTSAASELTMALYQGNEELREAEQKGLKDIAAKEQNLAERLHKQDLTKSPPIADVQDAIPGGKEQSRNQASHGKNAPARGHGSVDEPKNDERGGRPEKNAEKETKSGNEVTLEQRAEQDIANKFKQELWEGAEKHSDDITDEHSDEDTDEDSELEPEQSTPESRKLAEEEARRQQEEDAQHELDTLCRELEELREEQAKRRLARAKFLRELKDIEDSTHWLPRVVIFNRSNVNVHMRLYSSPFHLVWCYANNVVPGSFAILSCPASGFYSLDVCLATGTSSEFTTAGQAGCTAGKVCLGVATVASGAFAGFVGNAVVEGFFTAASTPAVLGWADAAASTAGAIVGSTGANSYARRLFSFLVASTTKRKADISVTAAGDLTPENYDLMKKMQRAIQGRDSLRLLDCGTMWLWRTKKLALRHGPELVPSPQQPESEGDSLSEKSGESLPLQKMTYRFTSETKALAVQNRDEFDEDAPAPPSPLASPSAQHTFSPFD